MKAFRHVTLILLLLLAAFFVPTVQSASTVRRQAAAAIRALADSKFGNSRQGFQDWYNALSLEARRGVISLMRLTAKKGQVVNGIADVTFGHVAQLRWSIRFLDKWLPTWKNADGTPRWDMEKFLKSVDELHTWAKAQPDIAGPNGTIIKVVDRLGESLATLNNAPDPRSLHASNITSGPYEILAIADIARNGPVLKELQPRLGDAKLFREALFENGDGVTFPQGTFHVECKNYVASSAETMEREIIRQTTSHVLRMKDAGKLLGSDNTVVDGFLWRVNCPNAPIEKLRQIAREAMRNALTSAMKKVLAGRGEVVSNSELKEMINAYLHTRFRVQAY